MDGAGEESFEVAERCSDARHAAAGSGDRRREQRSASCRLQRQVKPSAQLGRGLAREGDGSDVLDLVGAGRDAGSHALGEHLRLAGAGAGFDEQVGLQLLADDAAGLARPRAASRTAGGLTHAPPSLPNAFSFCVPQLALRACS